MALLKKLILGFAVFTALVIGIGLLLPSEFEVQRSIDVNATPAEVYAEVSNLRKWRAWGVWFKRDPKMQLEYSGPEGAVGMKSAWISEAEGSGEMTITAMEPNKSITYSLYFPDFDMGSTGELTLTANGDVTTVTWRDYGDVGMNPVNRYFAVMMDTLIGPDFETGLENLKMVAEAKI